MTRRDFTLKWATYALVILTLCFLHSFTLAHVRILRVIPFLPPVALAVICSLENNLQGTVFSIVFGALCDMICPGAFPCIYTVSFFLAALVILLLAHSVLQPGFFCALAAVVTVFFFLDLFCAVPLLFAGHASVGAALSLFLRELTASLVLLPVCYGVFAFLNRFFTI